MARKVLISFIGTGPVAPDKSSERVYRKAKYSLDDKIIESPFIASALGQFLQIDTYFLFGTMKSMWEEVYRHFCRLKEQEPDEGYWIKLAEKCGEKTNHETPPDKDLFYGLEQILDNKSRICPVHYGLNREEIESNFKIFSDAVQELSDGDEIYLDITHSFRSLPLFATTALSFIKDVINKKVDIKGIFYGMLEASSEFNNTVPVVNLSYISEIQDWIKGAYTFTQFGNGQMLADLLKEKNSTVSEKLKDFTNTLSINFITDIKSQISVLKTLIDEKDYDLPEKLVIPQAFKRFADFFKNAGSLSDYQFLLCKWHKQKSNIALSYMCLVESIVTFVCEKQKWDVKSEEKREEAKRKILNDDICGLRKIFKAVNKIRNQIAHVVEVNKSSNKTDLKKSIDDLKNYIKDFEKIKQSC